MLLWKKKRGRASHSSSTTVHRLASAEIYGKTKNSTTSQLQKCKSSAGFNLLAAVQVWVAEWRSLLPQFQLEDFEKTPKEQRSNRMLLSRNWLSLRSLAKFWLTYGWPLVFARIFIQFQSNWMISAWWSRPFVVVVGAVWSQLVGFRSYWFGLLEKKNMGQETGLLCTWCKDKYP